MALWGSRLRIFAHLTFCLLVAFLLVGCQTCRKGKQWGQCVTPSFYSAGCALRNAALDPQTWVPAAGALAFGAMNDWDHDVSDWAREKTPIFGSKQGATDGGELTRDIATYAALTTTLITPSGPLGPRWGWNKAKGIAIETAAVLAPMGISRWLKEETNRERPSGKDDLSFPSVISAEASAWSAMGRRNLRTVPMRSRYRTAANIGFTSLAALTAWSRVESGSHYPSDVLAGLAIGNFTSVFIHDALLGPSWRDFRVKVAPNRKAVDVGLTCSLDL